MLGAGGPIDPFWNMYAVHKTKEVLEILEEYRIGKLKVDSRVGHENCNGGGGITHMTLLSAIILNLLNCCFFIFILSLESYGGAVYMTNSDSLRSCLCFRFFHLNFVFLFFNLYTAC